MIYITVELNKDIYIKIPKVKEGISPYNLTMTSQAGGQQMVFADLVDNSDKSSVYKFILNFTQYTPSGIYNYALVDSADKLMSKGLIQVNMNNTDDYFYADDELGYFVEDEEGGGDMSNYYTKSQVDSMLTQYEKKSDLPDFNNFVTEEELGEYVTSEELQQEVESYINSKDLINSTQLANTLEWYVTLNELQGMSYVTASELPTVNDATITIKQGGEVMGSFTLNQTNNAEILLNEGGQGGGISMNDVKQYVDSQSYVTSDYLTSQSYVTSDYLGNAGYITTDNVRQNYYNKPETEANFTSYAYIEERISRIPGGGITMDEVKQYIVSQSYVTSDYLTSQSYLKSSDLNDYATKTYVETKIADIDLSSYITKQDIVNQSYVTKNALECNYYSKTDINSMGYITSSTLTNYATKSYVQEKINEIPGVDLSAYLTKQELVNQAYITATQLNDYATKTYVETKIADIDLSSYLTKQELVNQAYITSNDLTDYATKAYVQEKINEIPVVDLSSYVKYSDLNNYGYQTSAQVQNTVNTSISNLNTVTLVFTLSDDTTRTIISYVQ
jgi:hypothetical protein